MLGACLTFFDLTLGYGGHPAVHYRSDSARRKSLKTMMGASRSGKSTLVKGSGRPTPHQCWAERAAS